MNAVIGRNFELLPYTRHRGSTVQPTCSLFTPPPPLRAALRSLIQCRGQGSGPPGRDGRPGGTQGEFDTFIPGFNGNYNTETLMSFDGSTHGLEALEALRGHPVKDTLGLKLALYLGLSIASMLAGYVSHPTLVRLTASVWNITPGEDALNGNFEASFFQLLAIVYGLFSGQTFLFLYERQINLVQELYSEVFALELLVQQTFLCCQSKMLRLSMAMTARQYIMEELYNPTDMESPFQNGCSYMKILDVLDQMQGQGMAVANLVEACRQLADAQSRRSAMAAQILPLVHWVFMHAMEVLFLATFLLFDAAELPDTDTPLVRSCLFGALVGLLALTSQVLQDLENPFTGMYSFKANLDDRIAYLAHLLRALEGKPETYMPSSVQKLSNLGMMATASKGTATQPLNVPKYSPRRRGRHVKLKQAQPSLFGDNAPGPGWP